MAAKEAWNERYRIESRFRIPEQSLSSTKIYKTPDEALGSARRPGIYRTRRLKNREIDRVVVRNGI